MKYTDAMNSFLASHATTQRKELTALFNEKFNTTLSENNIKAKCLRMGLKTGRTGCFEKGLKTWNKGLKGYMGANATSFKKGSTPKNTRPDGSERICSKDGYVLIKVNGKFMYKHRHLWELHNGPIPEGCNISFINKDKTDIRIENLILVSNQENGILNKCYSKISNPESHLSLIVMSKIRAAILSKGTL